MRSLTVEKCINQTKNSNSLIPVIIVSPHETLKLEPMVLPINGTHLCAADFLNDYWALADALDQGHHTVGIFNGRLCETDYPEGTDPVKNRCVLRTC